MPSLTFLGAARTVTGSKYLLEVNDRRVLVDCGLFQGLKELRERNWQPLPVPASSIDAVVLTHAHIDHCGFLPRLFAEGFRGRVFCTPGTADLCRIVLPDAGRIAEEDAREANRHGYSKHRPALPLFTEADAYRVLVNLQPVGFDRPVPVDRRRLGPLRQLRPPARLRVRRARPRRRRRPRGRLQRRRRALRPAGPARSAAARSRGHAARRIDLRRSRPRAGRRRRRAGRDRLATRSGAAGRSIIPAFAIGRVEEVIYWLKKLEDAGRIPVVPVFLDSPMALEALEHYAERAGELDPDVQAGARPGVGLHDEAVPGGHDAAAVGRARGVAHPGDRHLVERHGDRRPRAQPPEGGAAQRRATRVLFSGYQAAGHARPEAAGRRARDQDPRRDGAGERRDRAAALDVGARRRGTS